MNRIYRYKLIPDSTVSTAKIKIGLDAYGRSYMYVYGDVDEMRSGDTITIRDQASSSPRPRLVISSKTGVYKILKVSSW